MSTSQLGLVDITDGLPPGAKFFRSDDRLLTFYLTPPSTKLSVKAVGQEIKKLVERQCPIDGFPYMINMDLRPFALLLSQTEPDLVRDLGEEIADVLWKTRPYGCVFVIMSHSRQLVVALRNRAIEKRQGFSSRIFLALNDNERATIRNIADDFLLHVVYRQATHLLILRKLRAGTFSILAFYLLCWFLINYPPVNSFVFSSNPAGFFLLINMLLFAGTSLFALICLVLFLPKRYLPGARKHKYKYWNDAIRKLCGKLEQNFSLLR